MLELWSMTFFRHAVIGLLIISVASAVIGTYIVTRRLVAISGGITHACFGGLGIGYFFGISPILMATVVAIASALGVEWLAQRHRVREDSAIAVVWALGMAIGIIFVFLTPGAVPELNNFLFGNVLTITRADLWLFAIYTALVAAFFLCFHRQVVACAFDPDFARVIGLRVRLINYTMVVIVAVGIVLTIRLVGVMLLMSMLALPQMIAETRCKRFYSLMWGSILVAVACCMTGLWLGTLIDVPCSALIVMVMVGLYIIAFFTRHISFTKTAAAIAMVVIVATTSGCVSQKKNTAAIRNYTAFITRYNIYFNGDEHYKTTLKEMEEKYDDDFTQLVLMHPIEAKLNEKAPQPTGSFTRSIEKAQKAIQIRSIKKRPQRQSGKRNNEAYKAWMKREEYNPFLHNAWMLMARSQYYNGDFLGAASTFLYISKHFGWLPETVLEAKMWQARAYCSAGWVVEADNIISRIKEEELTTNALREVYYFTYADVLIHDEKLEAAIPYLEKAVKYASGAQKTRLRFLLGQLYERAGNPTAAYEVFKKVADNHSATYRTRFNARIKLSEVYTGSNISKEVKSLKSMTRYERNRDYLDQIYYAIGNLYLSRGDTTQAIANYIQAVDQSTRNGVDKAIAQITLGNLYFKRRQYVEAQPCYAEAVPVLPDNYPDLPTLKRRSDVLDELARYAGDVQLQDSLLRLSYMTEAERLVVIDGIIKELNRKEKEEAARQAAEERQAELENRQSQLPGSSSSANAPTTFNLNTDKSWYFYNRQSIDAGRSEFRKKWGSRKLEDDWRRRNKMIFSFEEFEDEDEESAEEGQEGSEKTSSEEKSQRNRAADPHYPEYYLKQIPSTDAERTVANEIIQEGLYNMGLILKDKLEDFEQAETQFLELLRRYPDSTYRLDAYYNLYMMYMRQGRTADVERMRLLIVSEFPASKYGEAMRDPNYFEHLREMQDHQEALYAATYEAYLANRNTEVHQAYEEMRERYPMSSIMPKFMFLNALSYVTEGDSEKFGAALRELLERYPDTDITPMASSYLKGLAQGRQLHATSSNLRGLVLNTRLTTNDSIAEADQAAKFVLDPDTPHLLILLYPTDSVNGNQLLYDVARFNFNSFMVKDFDLEQMTFGPLGLIIVKGLATQHEAEVYRSRIESSPYSIYRDIVRPVIISTANFDTMLRSGSSFEAYFQAMEQADVEATEESILPDLPPAEEPSLENTDTIDSIDPLDNSR